MSYTTGTTHYNLPQTVGTDKRDWADTNQAFQDIDAAIYGAVQDTAQAASDIDALEARMDTAEQNIATNTGDIAGLDTRLTTAEGAITSQASQITDTRQDLEDMICAYNEASATSTHAYAIGDYFIYNDVLYKATAAIGIGDTIVPDTNCATTNVTTEVKAIQSSINGVDVSYTLGANVTLVGGDRFSCIKKLDRVALNAAFTIPSDSSGNVTLCTLDINPTFAIESVVVTDSGGGANTAAGSVYLGTDGTLTLSNATALTRRIFVNFVFDI